MEDRVYLEEYTVGEKFVTPGRTITEADITNYAGLTGDWHPMHTNVEFAKQTPFGERIAHGMLSLCVGSTLIFRLGYNVVFPKAYIAFYGMDSIRFTAPVKIGDTIRCEVEVMEIQMKDEKRGVLVERNVIKNQRDEDVIVYITRYLVGRKPK